MAQIESDLLAKSSFEKWMITITVMLVSVIEVLDMTIVNVALAPMMGSLGASFDQITWVLTSYIVSSAIFMVLTGFLVNRFGRKKLLVWNILGFFLASMLCGIATSLPEIVLFRTLQGIFGAALVPLSQLILRTTYTKKEFGTAMAIWGIGIMVAPVLGPTLGGYITDNLTWRWVFYINAPVCVLSFFMALRFIKETPTVKDPIDWLGMIFMAIGVGSLQIFLDRGNSENWFQSDSIIFLLVTAITFLSAFVYRSLNYKNPIINLSLFKDRDFVLACLLITLFCAGMFGLLSIQPLLLEQYLGYPTEFTGYVMAPRGIGAAFGMILASIFIKKIDARIVALMGTLFAAYGTYMMTSYNLLTSEFYWEYSGFIQGIGTGLFFVPISTIMFNTLAPKDIPAASGFFSFARNIGISVGISILSTVVSRQTQINWNRFSGHITNTNYNLVLWLHKMGWTIHSPLALSQLEKFVSFNATMIAFINCFFAVSISFVILIPIIFMAKKPTLTADKETPMH